MLGHRGCRLAITFPEIYEIQTRAIGEAAAEVAAAGIAVHPEIMIPLVMLPEELRRLRELVARTFDAALGGATIPYTIGTMIELPRACVVADQIAAHADFFSFGTNDLTQTTLRAVARRRRPVPAGLPRRRRAPDRPVRGARPRGRRRADRARRRAAGAASSPTSRSGSAASTAASPASVEFCHDAGLDYVSCSPFRVPIARVAAARAALSESTSGKK